MNRLLFFFTGMSMLACSSDVAITQQSDRLVVSPQVADAGMVAVGQTALVELQLDALTNFDIPIRAINILNIEGDYFSLEDEAMPVVPGGGTIVVPIAYTPTDLGYHQARITIVSNSREAEIEVYVRGAARDAAASLWPPVIDFGVMEEGESDQLALNVRNDGNTPLTLEEMVFSDPAFSAGYIGVDLLTPGSTFVIPIEYTADSENAASAQLEVDFGITGLLQPVTLRANDCENGTPSAYDRDEDGYTSCAGDCDDDDDGVHPGAVEEPDDVDQDCDGIIDEGTINYDDDGDGYSEVDGDCNDGDETVNPGVEEDFYNGRDDDCDGVTDFGGKDLDSDGYAVDADDCDDSDATIYPGAEELPDGKDNDCDGTIDEGTVRYDDDGDGMTEDGGDCDDTDSTIYKDAPELPDWQDNDCDTTVDEGTTNYDDDGDGYSELGGDCDDTNDKIGPASLEIKGDGIDNDCDGVKS